jgi:SAM-dependent methyltransferase
LQLHRDAVLIEGVPGRQRADRKGRILVVRSQWSEVWAERVACSSLRTRLGKAGMSTEDFWSGFSHLQDLRRYIDYPGRLLDRILESVDGEATVLDVGAGGGALAIPMARAGKSVTAVEPSPGQVSRLCEDAERAGVGNVTVIEKRWEDVGLRELGSHDIAVAAHSIVMMEDIGAAIEKLCDAARWRVFIIHFVDHDLERPLEEIVDGLGSMPDYIFPYNVLYDMGYRPNVEIYTREYELPLGLQLDALGYSRGLSQRQRERLCEYLRSEGRTSEQDGETWVRRQHRDALITVDTGKPD